MPTRSMCRARGGGSGLLLAERIVTQRIDEPSRPWAGRLDAHAPLRLRHVLEMHVDAVRGEVVARAIGPLDDRDAAGLERLLPAGRAELLAREAVEIEVIERQAPAEVLVEDDERRAGHRLLVEAEADGDASRQHGLPRPELSPERDDVPGLRVRGHALAEPFGVERGVADEVDRARLSLRATLGYALRIGGVHGRAEC